MGSLDALSELAPALTRRPDSAREHGLTADKSVGEVVAGLQSGDLAGTVKQVAKDLSRSGDEAIRKDGLKTDVGANGSSSS